MLGIELPVWENIMLVALGAAALTGAAVAVSTLAVIRLQRTEAVEKDRAFAEYQSVAGIQIAEANARAEVARLETEQIQLKLAPRWLTGEQQAAVRKALEPFPGMVAHIWLYPVGTPDSWQVAQLMSAIFKGVGWQTGVWTSLSGHPSIGGILISWRGGSDTNAAAAKALVAALKAAGIDAMAAGAFEKDDLSIGPQGEASQSPDEKMTIPPTIRVFVGTKP